MDSVIPRVAELLRRFGRVILLAPPGWGKTQTTFDVARNLGYQSITIITHRRNIAQQWVRRAAQNGIAANVLSAFARGKYTFRGFVAIDEIHHAQSDSYQSIVKQAVGAGKRVLGLTAMLTTESYRFLKKLGFFFPQARRLRCAGRAVPVKFKVMGTWARWHNDQQRANDQARNQLIKDIALSMKTKGKIVLILTRLRAHASILEKNGAAKWWEPRRKLDPSKLEGPFVTTYSFASEGFHPQNLEGVILATPSKSMIRIIQSIGRGNQNSCSEVVMLIDRDPTSWRMGKLATKIARVFCWQIQSPFFEEVARCRR